MNSGLFTVSALGFCLGMRHATDPDHVLAVTTIVARQRSVRGAALIGAAWGLGHSLTILVVGGGIILFNWVIPVRVGLSMEFSVGLMLIVLGLMNLVGVRRQVLEAAHDRASGLHSHPHRHGDYVHTHPHRHDPEAHPHRDDQTPMGWLDRWFGGMTSYQLLRPLVVGVVHGLAGSAAVALLVLATIREPNWGIIYLLLFGMGTMVGMMLITAFVAVPFAYTGSQPSGLGRGLRTASGLISLAFGCFLAYQVGFVGGLFTEHPQWTPH